MARKTKPLTDTEIKAAKPKDADYQLYDGDGLTLLIKSSGSKLWQFRYYRPLTKQRTKQSFGAYPAVSLSDARKLRAESKVLLAKEIDPQEHQKEQVRNSQEAKFSKPLQIWLAAQVGHKGPEMLFRHYDRYLAEYDGKTAIASSSR